MLLPFGEFRPDAAALAEGTATARNVVPGPDGDYLSLPSLVEFSSPLPERARGAMGVRSQSNETYFYAADESSIWQLAGMTWIDRSKVGGYTTLGNERWEFAQYGNNVYAASKDNPVQVSTINGSVFADLFSSTLKPKAKHIAVVNRDWLVLGNTADAVDGDRAGRVWWTARGNPADADPSVTNQSGFEDLDSEDGQVQAVIGGEYGTIVATKAIWRMTYEGGDVGYRFDKILRARGALASGSVCSVDRLVFFMDEDGFHVCDGSQAIPIGEGKVSRTALAALDKTNKEWICSAIYPEKSVVMWGIPTNGANISRLYLYNWKSNRWTESETNAELVFSAFTSPVFIDDASVASLLIDSPPQSLWNLDSAEFVGGYSAFGAFDTEHKLKFFSGPSQEAVIDTNEQHPFPGMRASVTEVRPLIEGASDVYVSMFSRENLYAAPVQSAEVGLNMIGTANVHAQGRYMRSRVRIPAGSNFTHAIGCDPNFTPEGRR